MATDDAAVRAWRDDARQRLARQGLPGRHDEHWRRTPVDAFKSPGEAATALPTHDSAELRLTPLRAALQQAPALLAFLPNELEADERHAWTAHAEGDGTHVLVRAGAAPAAPIVLRHGGGAALHLVQLEAGARATLVEDGTAPLQALHVVLAPGARLVHWRVARADAAALDTLRVDVGGDATYEQRLLVAADAPWRSTQTVRLAGRGASARLASSFVALAQGHADLRVLVRHDADATTSDVRSHVLGASHGRATLDVEAHVPRGRKAVRAEQLLRALPLHGRADLALRPRLSILADDVVCRHGATTAAIRPEELHYLRTRGLPRAEALALLAEGFLRQPLGTFDDVGDGDSGVAIERTLRAALAQAVEASDAKR